MALRTPALFMGNPAVNHTAQSMRLAKAGLLRPETGQAAATRPLTAASGVLAGPAGTMGEVTLLSNTQFTVNPARWFIQSSDTPLGGVYEVTNDAVETIAITAQDATQFRKAYFGVWVIDSFVAGSGDDQPHWGLVNGALVASNPQLPAAGTLPENFLALGEFLIPPTGQSVTYTGYTLRTGPRGGIVPVVSADTRAGAYDGAYRDFPLGTTTAAGGPQRWNGTAAAWEPVSARDFPAYRAYQTTAATGLAASTWYNMGMQTVAVDTHGVWVSTQNDRFTCPAGQGGIYAVSGTVSFIGSANGISADVRLAKNGTGVYGSQAMLGEVNSVALQLTTGLHLIPMVPGDYVVVQGYYAVNAWQTLIGGAGNEGISSSLQAFRIR